MKTKSKMKNIKLNKIEYNFLLNSSFLSDDWKQLIITSTQQIGVAHIITIEEDQSDALRDLFGEELQFIGFDENYKPTQEGEILESLIDKFFCG